MSKDIQNNAIWNWECIMHLLFGFYFYQTTACLQGRQCLVAWNVIPVIQLVINRTPVLPYAPVQIDSKHKMFWTIISHLPIAPLALPSAVLFWRHVLMEDLFALSVSGSSPWVWANGLLDYALCPWTSGSLDSRIQFACVVFFVY